MSNEITHAYTAGLFDGEGTVTISRCKKANRFRYPRASISSTTKELLLFLKETYGGSISFKKTYKKHHKESWTWSLSSLPVMFSFFKIILPYIKEPEKIRRINLILDVYKSVTPRNGQYSGRQLIGKYAFEEEFFKNTDKNVNNFKL